MRKCAMYVLFGILVLLLILFLGLVAHELMNVFYYRTQGTHFSLIGLRSQIEQFKGKEGRYPQSLTEISSLPLREYLSTSKGNGRERNVLNGEGGWCYDPNTGEVRVNLTKPVKQYLWFYFGEDIDEVPSQW